MTDDLLETSSKSKGAVIDFAQGFLHAAIESPINGLTQIISKGRSDHPAYSSSIKDPNFGLSLNLPAVPRAKIQRWQTSTEI